MRKNLLCIAVAVTTLLGAASSADAQRPCPPGWRPAPSGRCVRMRGPARWRVGVWYPGRGWWDGRRWWRHRTRWHGGWRYR